MTDEKTFGRLEPVSIRTGWQHEALDFTPWLAQDENISLLSNTVGLGAVTVEATERAVGRFSADIVGRDEGNGYVLIENQLEPTDHRHLGQILTYLAGLEGRATVIWIATKVLDEHRAAVDWLNTHTSDQFDFFAVELQLWRIGSSPVAPRFHVVAKPNNWSRTVARMAGMDSGNPTETNVAYTRYWAKFSDYLQSLGGDIQVRKTPKDYWCGFESGVPHFTLGAVAKLRDSKIGVELEAAHPSARTAFDLLFAGREAVESELGYGLDWDPLVGKKSCRISIRTFLDPNVEEQWPAQHAWFQRHLTDFRRVLCPRLRALGISGSGQSEASVEDA